ncbi:MAG TPA: class I SAM-dependent methyltransferase [Nannocystis sp.]
MLELCPRLAAIAELVLPGRPLADIGTDHGRLPAALVLRGVVPRAFACDRAAGPVARARATVTRNGIADRVAVRSGEGLAPLAIGEADTVVVAGMGAETIVRILAGHPDRTRALRRLVLQPNFGHELLRRWLVAHHFMLVDERLTLDRGRFYTVIAAEPAAQDATNWRDWDDAQWAIGPFVLRRGGPLLVQHLTAELRLREAEAAGLAQASAPDPARVAAATARVALLADALAKATALAHPGSA